MAAKENKNAQEIKALIADKKAIIGKNEVIKALKLGKAVKVFLAKNAPEELRSDLDYYTNMANVEVVDLDVDNEELGVLCKKNFFICTLAQSA